MSRANDSRGEISGYPKWEGLTTFFPLHRCYVLLTATHQPVVFKKKQVSDFKILIVFDFKTFFSNVFLYFNSLNQFKIIFNIFLNENN